MQLQWKKKKKQVNEVHNVRGPSYLKRSGVALIVLARLPVILSRAVQLHMRNKIARASLNASRDDRVSPGKTK